jgi:hypothetical protein
MRGASHGPTASCIDVQPLRQPDADVDEWQPARGRHVGFGALAGLTGVLLTVDDGLGPARRYAAFAILAALCGWYAAVGGRALHRGSNAGGLAYVALAAALTVALFAVAPVGAVMLHPHIRTLLPMRQAVAATVLTLVATAAAMVADGTCCGGAGGAGQCPQTRRRRSHRRQAGLRRRVGDPAGDRRRSRAASSVTSGPFCQRAWVPPADCQFLCW